MAVIRTFAARANSIKPPDWVVAEFGTLADVRPSQAIAVTALDFRGGATEVQGPR